MQIILIFIIKKIYKQIVHIWKQNRKQTLQQYQRTYTTKIGKKKKMKKKTCNTELEAILGWAIVV